MAISVTNLLGPVGDATDRVSYAVSSATYTAGRYYILCFATSKTSTPDDATNAFTDTQPGWTGVQVRTVGYNTTASPTRKVHIWAAVCATTRTTTATIDFNGVTQTGLVYSLTEVTGMDPTTPIVQSNSNTSDSATALTVSLSAFANASNVSFGAFSRPTNGQITQGSGFTELSDAGYGTPPCRLEVEFQTGDVDPNITSASDPLGGVGMEIAIAPTATLTHFLSLLGVGA